MTRQRVIAYAWMISVGYLVAMIALHLMAVGQAAQGQAPMVTDFNTYYALPLLLREQPAARAYDVAPMHTAERQAMRHAYPGLTETQLNSVPPFRWMYPPHFMAVVQPLAALPYWVAYIAWGGLTLLLWLAVLRRILPGSAWLPLALALPSTFLNAMFGQNGFLTAGLLGLGLTLLETQPILAGMAFGALTIKPHLGLLLPVALIVGGYWRATASAIATAAVLVSASAWGYGLAPWQAFLSHLGDGGQLMEAGGVPWSLMPTVFPALRLLGLGSAPAFAGQAAVSALTVIAVIWAWRQKEAPFGLRAAALCLATPLAVPFAHAYDLVLLSLPLFWLARQNLIEGWRRDEAAVMALTALLPFLVPGLGRYSLPVGPPVIAALLAMTLRRIAQRPFVNPNFDKSNGNPL